MNRQRQLARRALATVIACSSLFAIACRPGGGGGGNGNLNGGIDGGPLPPATGVAVTREVDPAFPNRTIWRPTDMAKAGKLPVLVWGEGGCMAPSSVYETFQREVASHGYFIVASGVPDKQGPTTPDMLRESITLATRENTKAGGKYQGKLDTTKVAASGQSCGGIEALAIGDDPRLTTVFVWNSGIFDNGGMGGGTKTDIDELHTPTLWVTGGSSDLAYAQAKTDYARAKVPAVWANYGNIGHAGSYNSPRGGLFAQVELLWMDWFLKGRTANEAYFVGASCTLCTTKPWNIVSKGWN